MHGAPLAERARSFAALLAAAMVSCGRSSLDATGPDKSLDPTRQKCLSAVPSNCRGLKVVTKDVPLAAPVRYGEIIARNGGFEWLDGYGLERFALAGSPPVLIRAASIPLDTAGIDGVFDDIATDGVRLYGCTRGRHNQLYVYDGSNVRTALLEFPEAADNPCWVAAFGTFALMTYDVFDADRERRIITDYHGYIASTDKNANLYAGSYGCGLFDWSGTYGGGGYNMSQVSVTAIPMDGRARKSFDLALAEPGLPSFARWPYEPKSIAVASRTDDPRGSGDCNVHMVVVTDDGTVTISQAFPLTCTDFILGQEGLWMPHLVATGFGPVLDFGNGDLQLLDSSGRAVGRRVTLSRAPGRDGENTLSTVADDSHLVALVEQSVQTPGGHNQTLQTIVTCDDNVDAGPDSGDAAALDAATE